MILNMQRAIEVVDKKTPKWQQINRNRHSSETSILSAKSKTHFPPKISAALFALPHMNEPPTCAPCAPLPPE